MNENFSQKDIENGFYPLRPFQKWIIDRNFHKVTSTIFFHRLQMKEFL